MKKLVVISVLFILLFSILANSAFILAEEDNSSDSNRDDSDSEDKNSDDSEDEDELESETETEDENETNDDEDDTKEQTRERIEERLRDRETIRKEFTREVRTEDGARIKIERKVETSDGEVNIKIKKTIAYANGTTMVIEIEMERNENGITREIQIEGEGVAIDSDLEIDDLFEENESELRAVLSNGNTTRIKVLPERARIIVRERLRNGNISNVTLEEIRHKNIPRVVYNIESNENGKFLGIFKLKLKSETQIDPETGEIIDVNAPWWAFLVSVPEEEISDEETGNAAGTFEEGSVINESDEVIAQ